METHGPLESTPGRGLGRAAATLAVMTLVAGALCGLLFLTVLKGEWMTGLFEATASFLFTRPAWAVVAATSPLAAALLVGYGYMQRAIRKRAAAADGR